ncbi:MAG TPA: YihY/virulence factor BrkB family protein [Burkholderiaceae bacterium]|nr:YihY/virulence factor BrkB family protein [Burkholderiaceae bacterium]
MEFHLATSLVKQTVSAWLDDYAPSMGAALAYYTIFSIAPLLLIAISVAGIAFGNDAARGEVVEQLQGLMGAPAARAIEGMVESANKPDTGLVSTVIGACLMLVGATTVFGELQNALDRIWRAPQQDHGGWLNLLRARLLSFGLILAVGFLILVSLLFSAAMAALGTWLGPAFGGWELLACAVNMMLSFALVSSLFAVIYKVMPRVRVAWRDVWVGALVTAALFTLGKWLIGLYIGKSGVTSVFGAAGSFAVLLLWVYYSAQIFLLGAEFTWIYAHEVGSLKGQPRTPAAG